MMKVEAGEAASESIIAGSGGDDEPNLCSRTRPRGSQLYPIEQTYLCMYLGRYCYCSWDSWLAAIGTSMLLHISPS